MKSIVGLFDNVTHAHQAIDDLQRLGVKKSDISVITQKQSADSTDTDDNRTHAAEGAGIGATTGAVAGGAAGILASLGLLAIPGIGPLLAAGPLVAALTGAGIGAATGGIIGGLVGLGIPEEDAEQYEEGVRRGGTVVTAKLEDAHADAASAIFERHHAVDLDSRSQEWRSAGWQPKHASNAAPRPQPRATTSGASAARRGDDSARIPVIDETLSVGKRAVEKGGVRVYAHMSEKPVSEQVNLRKETVHVDRRPADRAATEADLQSFKEGTIEMRETSEEAVVQKQARVTGEVVVRKDVENRQETVRDTVRRTDVKVEKIDPAGSGRS